MQEDLEFKASLESWLEKIKIKGVIVNKYLREFATHKPS
jgi:hypothetical protein